MYDQTWIFGKAISPLFADRVTYIAEQHITEAFKVVNWCSG